MKLIIILLIFINSSIYANEDIEDFKSYITNLKSIAIDFSQIDNSNKLIKGKLIIHKPYNFRCNYYEPFPLLIVGNKSGIIIYDYEMEQTSHISSDENIFNFLLLDKKNFEKYFSIIEINKYKANMTVLIKHNNSNRDFEISFDNHKKQLNYVKMLEDNNIIQINFDKITNISKVDKALFKIKNVDIFGPPERYDAILLQKFLK